MFGVITFAMPAQMQYFIEKLFAQGIYFKAKIAASLITSHRLGDDFALDLMRFISEQLGLSYSGEVSADGENIFSTKEEERSEASCRILANKINAALDESFFPSMQNRLLPREFISAVHYGKKFEILGPPKKKQKGKILVITSRSILKNPAAFSIVAALKTYSQYTIEIVEIENYKINPCQECYYCMIDLSCKCRQGDELILIQDKMQEAQGIVLLANGTCGFVDVYMKTFLDRLSVLFHHPKLQKKYGFVCISGADIWGKKALDYLRFGLQSWGVTVIDSLLQIDDNLNIFSQNVKNTIENLDKAIIEKWQIPENFTIKSFRLAVAQHIKKHGLILRGEYNYFVKNNSNPKVKERFLEKFMNVLMKNSVLRKKIISMLRDRVKHQKKIRLKNLQAKGLLGKGKEIEQN